MSTLLTIDWDYFSNETPEMDLGHNESPMFMDMIWQTRGHLIDKLKASGWEDFWFMMNSVFDIKTDVVHVSESHCRVPEISHDYQQIINLDTHHDCWPFDWENSDIDCSTWGSWWKRYQLPSGELIWVRPNEDCLDMYDYPSVPITKMSFDEWLNYMSSYTKQVDGIHICRSGAWMPPWEDDNFVQFVGDTNLEVINIEPDGDPMKPRWTEQDKARAIAQAKAMEEQCKQMQRQSCKT